MKNYYEILGVAKNATLQDIKKNYREKFRQYHPDRVRDLPIAEQAIAEDKMKLINNAYSVLGDDGNRTEYDKQRSDGLFPYQSTLISGRGTQKNGRNIVVQVYQTIRSNKSTTRVIIKENNVVDFIHQFELSVSAFVEAAQKGSAKHYRILDKLDTLCVGLSKLKPILSKQNPSSTEFLDALQQCSQLIHDATAGSEFNSYRVIAKTIPVLLHVLHVLDVLGNLVKFLIEKTKRMSTGNTTSVFKNRNEFSIGIFKATHTQVFRDIEKLKQNLQWFSDYPSTEHNQYNNLN